jgi:hypothetical protein
MIGIQVGAVSFVDEGVDFRDRLSVFVAHFVGSLCPAILRQVGIFDKVADKVVPTKSPNIAIVRIAA